MSVINLTKTLADTTCKLLRQSKPAPVIKWTRLFPQYDNMLVFNADWYNASYSFLSMLTTEVSYALLENFHRKQRLHRLDFGIAKPLYSVS